MHSHTTVNKLLTYNLAHMNVLSYEQIRFEQRSIIKLAQILQKLETSTRFELICIKKRILVEYNNNLFPDCFLESVLLKIEKKLQKFDF